MVRGAAVVGVLALVALNGPSVQASSHREAPLISQDPVADNTDLYMFRDPANPGMVNILANFIGLEQPASGPNFVRFGDDVLYEIHIDNNGDVADDITYQFRFRTTVVNPNTALYNTGPISSPNGGRQNVQQRYSVRRIDKSGSAIIANNVNTPPVNIGPRSTRPTQAEYEAQLAQTTVTTLPGGGKVFAGQRSEPFYADLGSLFDRFGIRTEPFATGHDANVAPEPARDGLADKNVHTIALQLPISSVLAPGASGSDASRGSIIGSYASASRQAVRVLSTTDVPKNQGQWVQISRLGLPLVNELLIPLVQKDRWNSSKPEGDVARFGNFILDPEPARLVENLYSDIGINTPPGGAANRPDLLKLLTAQLIGAPASGPGAQAPADLLRVNLATPVTGGPGQNQNTVNRLGAIGGDGQGFPNGRRLADDVVDIQLRVFAGGILLGPPYNVFPNNVLTDSVNTSGSGPLLNIFPYAGTPISGFDQNDAFG